MREAAGGEGARDTESKTRTPHKDVGNKHHMIITFFQIPAPGMGSLLRVFLERRLEKGNGVRHLLGRWSESCRGQEA